MSSETFSIEAQRTHYVHVWQKWLQGTERLCEVSPSRRRCTDADCLVAFQTDRAWFVRCSALFCQTVSTMWRKRGWKMPDMETLCVFLCIILYLHNNFMLCSAAAAVSLNCQAPSESSLITDSLILLETCLSYIVKFIRFGNGVPQRQEVLFSSSHTGGFLKMLISFKHKHSDWLSLEVI